MRKLVCGIALAVLVAGPAWAQSGAPSDCSGTVGQTSAAIGFPSSGNTGPSRPQLYVTITNPSASATLFVNPNGAAVANGSGSESIGTNGYLTWASGSGYPPPASLNIIASAAATPYTCKYQ